MLKGGGIFNPKIYVADFGNFKQGFLSMKLIKRRVISGFRVCFFNNCIDINWYYLILTDVIWPMPPCINATISIIRILQYNFQKMRGGGVSFYKNSSDLVAGSFPNRLLFGKCVWVFFHQGNCFYATSKFLPHFSFNSLIKLGFIILT